MVVLTACAATSTTNTPAVVTSSVAPAQRLAVTAAATAPSPALPATPPPGSVSTGGVVTPASTHAAASNLQAKPHCAATGLRHAVADLTWTPASLPGTAQQVALTALREGFDTNRFELSPSLPADATTYTWPQGINPGGVLYWRVLTLQGTDWVSSDTASFTGPTCVADNATTPGP